MYPGKRYAILGGLLWLLATGAAAQEYRFRYIETVRSDYGSMMRAGAASALRTDTLIQEGRLSVFYHNDSVVSLRLHIERHLLPTGDAGNPVAEGMVLLDSVGRIREFRSAALSNAVFLRALPWLGELHFKQPSGEGRQSETHHDGNYLVTYSRQGALLLRKRDPVVSYPHATRQAMLFDHFSWEARFDENGKLRGTQLEERKRQYIGRQELACIGRQLRVTVEKSRSTFTGLATATGWQVMQPYKRLDETERRRRISANLLGNSDLDDLLKELAAINSANNEARFRVKSRWRALLILDSGTRTRTIRLYETQDSSKQELLEDAMLESGLFGDYFARRIDSLSASYSALRPLLIKISLAGIRDEALLRSLQGLVQSTDANISGTAALTLANLLPPLRTEAPARYSELSTLLLKPYQEGTFDTLQYLYLVGNAGISTEWPRLRPLLNGTFHNEALTALRHIQSEEATEVLLAEALLRDSLPPAFFNGLLAGRPLPATWVQLMSGRIQSADKRGSTALLPALQFLLDEVYRSHLDLNGLIRGSLQTAAYRDELADFNRAGALCNSSPD